MTGLDLRVKSERKKPKPVPVVPLVITTVTTSCKRNGGFEMTDFEPSKIRPTVEEDDSLDFPMVWLGQYHYPK
jgi:hypothetical protein